MSLSETKVPPARTFDFPLSPSLATLPETRGVYALRTPETTLHLSWTTNLRRRLTRLLDGRKASGARLAEQLKTSGAHIECWPTPSVLETSLLMYELSVRFFPRDYVRRLHLRSPWFVMMTADVFPRLTVSNRLSSDYKTALGPFPSREAASRYEEAVLPLFQLRRCTDALQPSPEHAGCVYGEMGLCMRPCQNRVTASEYASECERVLDLMREGTRPTLASLSASRERAAEELDFECAAQIHRQMQKLQEAEASRPPVIQQLESLEGIAVLASAHPGEALLRPLLKGYWQPAIPFSVPLEGGRGESLDARLRRAVLPALENPATSGNRLEHLAIFSRWYHSSYRTEGWLGFDGPAGPPYRKLGRAVSRLLQPPVDGGAKTREPVGTSNGQAPG